MAESSNSHQSRIPDWVVAFPRPECCRLVDQADSGQPRELGSDLRCRREHDMAKLIEGFDTGVDSGAAGDHQHPDRFHVPIPRLGGSSG